MIKQLSIRIDSELLKMVRMKTIKEDTSVNSIVINFLKKYIKQQNNREEN